MKLFIIALLITLASAATSSVASYNPFMRGGKHDVFLTTDSSNGLASYTFKVPFIHIINPSINYGLEVFYSIQDIQAQIFNQPDPTDPSFLNVQYEFGTSSIAADHLVTSIRAYLYIPFFRKFTFRYFLFQQGQMWRGTHLVCQNLKFTNGNKLALLPLPSTSTPTSNLLFTFFMSSIKIRFQQNDVKTDDNNYLIIDWSWAYDATNTNIELSLLISKGVERQNFFVQYVGLVFNKDAMKTDFIQYKFRAGWNSFAGGANSYSMTQYTAPSSQEYYFFGLSWITFELKGNDPSFDITLTQNYPSIRLQFLGKTGVNSINSFAYAIFQFVHFRCESPFYSIYDNVTLNCIDCTGNTYMNTSLVSCQPCRYDCLTCKSHYQCTTCDSTTFRALSTNFSCSPISGYYESNITAAKPCITPCKTCFGSASQCTSCVDTTTVAISYACVACSTIFEGCSDCHLTYCLSCDVGYTQINATYCNLPCSDTNCLICKNSDTTICQLCVNTFRLVDNKCLGACGNGILETGEVCDDGNYVLKDGCDSMCMPQPNYNCYQTTVSSKTFTTYCAYTKAIDFTILTTQKLPQGNIIQLVVEVKDYQQSFWKNKEILNCWFIDNIKYTGMEGRFLQINDMSQHIKLLKPKLSSYSKASLVYLQFEYLQTVQGKSVIVRFDTSNTFHSSLIQIPSSMKTHIIIPQNNHYAYLYSAQIYSKQELLSQVFLGLSIISYLLLLASLIIGNKRIIAQYIVLLQIAYTSLITLPGYNGMDYSLVSLRAASNGFNLLEGSAIRPFQDILSNERTKGMYAYSQFIYNLNTGLLFIIVPLIVGLIASILNCIKSFKEQTLKTIQKVKRLSLGQYTYTGLIVGGCSIGFAAGLQLQFGKQETDQTLSLISFALPFILLPLFILYAIFRFKKPQFFGQYHQQLSFTLSSLLFQISISMIGILSGLLLTYLYSLSVVNIFVIAFCLLLFIISVLNRQFKKGLDSYRTQLNLICLIIIQLPFAYVNFYGTSQYNSQDDVMILLPVCIAVVLSTGLILNLVFFIYLIIKKLRLYLSQKQQPPQEIKADEKNQSLIVPQQIKTGKFRKGFIETQAQQSPLQKTTFKDYNNLSFDFQQCKYPNSILKSIKPTINNQTLPQQQACMGTIEQKKFILSTIHKMDEL